MHNHHPDFREAIHSGAILVSDGATGTNLQARGLERGVPGERWVLERPEEILRLESDFIAAGSNVVLTCTFGASRMHLETLGLADKMLEINRNAVEIARQASQGKVFVAGSIGPIGQLLKPYGTLDVADAEATFAEQISVLAEAGVDVLVVETQFDINEAAAAVRSAKAVCDLPVVCSFSYDRGTRTMMGVKPSQAATEMAALSVDMIGMNCGRSLEDNLKGLQELHAATQLPIWFKPNAGLPRTDENGQAVYDISPEMMGAHVATWVENGAVVIGGCCGTSPEHLQAIADAVKKVNQSRQLA